MEQKIAWRFWAPIRTNNPHVGPAEQIFVLGSYLVRSTSNSRSVVHISSDSDTASTIEVYLGATAIETLDWNGKRLAATKMACGSYTAQIPGVSNRKISLPVLENWHSADSLPEEQLGCDDSKWIPCDKNPTTLSPITPLYLPVLYSSDYGFYTGPKIYRGTFNNKSFTCRVVKS